MLILSMSVYFVKVTAPNKQFVNAGSFLFEVDAPSSYKI